MAIFYQNQIKFWAILFLFTSNSVVRASEVNPNLLFDAILENTNYDLRQRPDPSQVGSPITVTTSAFVYFLGHIDDERLELETMMMLRHRWYDPRLQFSNAIPPDENSTTTPFNPSTIPVLEGESWYADRLWTPNLFIENEEVSEITEMLRENTYIRILPNGYVEFNYRVASKTFCDMDLHKFPHDKQQCSIILESWTLSTTDMILQWEEANPLMVADFPMAEYTMIANSSHAGTSCYSNNYPSPRIRKSMEGRVTFNGARCENHFDGRNYSTLTITFDLSRELGHYILDYYIPSIILVSMSWVAFWLHPSAVPGRTTLGTSTWLTFITLTHNTGTNSLPKVSYIKFLDIWFLGCTFFIFTSLLEFAFVNSISRRKEQVKVKSLSAKNVLPAAASVFATPAVSRKNSPNGSLYNDRRKKKKKSSSMSSLGSERHDQLQQSTVHSMDSFVNSEADSNYYSVTLNVPSISLPDGEVLSFDNRMSHAPPISQDIEEENKKQFFNFEDMTGEEIALWIDMKARIVFPTLFALFNLFYWIFAFV